MKVTTDGKDGGIFIGHLHSQGGEPAVVSSSLSKSGMPIEVEDGEAIIKRDAVSSDKVLKVKGRPCEILSEINQRFGGRKIPCDKVVYSKTKKGIFEKGGKINHYKEEKVRTGDYEIDISKIYREFGKNIVTVPVSLFETRTESENKINNIKINDDDDIVGVFTIVNKKPFLIDGNHRTEQMKRKNVKFGKYIYIPFGKLLDFKKNVGVNRLIKIGIINFAKENNIKIKNIKDRKNRIIVISDESGNIKKDLLNRYIGMVKKSTKFNIIQKWK